MNAVPTAVQTQTASARPAAAAPPPGLLSAEAAAVVAATAPAVAAHAEEITALFYPSMFAARPDLLRIFNKGNQATGEQSRALAASVVAYAVQLIDPDAPSFQHVMRRIAHKHVSLGISGEQYTIVGHHLLGAVAEVLGDAVTPEVADAWGEVYWLFAMQLVAEEARLYQQAGIRADAALRPYVVVRRIDEAHDIISLVLEPDDGLPLPTIEPGQYVSVFVDPDRAAFGRARGVDGAPDGRVSTYLHDGVQVGDRLEVSTACGDFVVPDAAEPLLLASAGAGITTVLPIVEHIARTQPQRPVIVAHADRTAKDHALRDTVRYVGRSIDNFTTHDWYEKVGPDDTRSRSGYMDLNAIDLPKDVQVFTCGPLPFMRHVRSTLLARGVPAENIRYEVFGPDLWAAQGEQPA